MAQGCWRQKQVHWDGFQARAQGSTVMDLSCARKSCVEALATGWAGWVPHRHPAPTLAMHKRWVAAQLSWLCKRWALGFRAGVVHDHTASMRE